MAAFAFCVVVLLGISGVLLAPRWIDLDPVRKKIETAASSALHGDVKFKGIDFSWFPRPRVVVRQVELSVPGTARGTVRSVSLIPAVRPLLRGRVRLSRIEVDGPDLAAELSEAGPEKKAGRRLPLLQSVTPVLWTLGLEAQGSIVEVSGGRVAVSRGGETLAVIRDLDFAFSLKGSSTLHADVKLSASQVSLRRAGRAPLDIEGLHVEAGIDLAEGRTDVTLSRFSVDSPRLTAEAAFRTDATAPMATVTARGTGLDVTSLRGKLMGFAGDDPTVRNILTIFRGGTLTNFAFDAAGETPADLGVFQKMSISATLADGSVRIGSVGLDLSEASGDVDIDGGVLSAENAAARVGNSRAWDGSVRVGLAKGDDTLRVEARVRSDLAELPGILARAIRSGSFREELHLVENLAGSATGRLTLENRRGKLETNVSVSEVRLSGNYARIPIPLSIRNGAFFFDGTRVGVSRLSGRLGNSTFSGLAARLRLGDSPSFEDVSGTAVVSLDELFPWLESGEGMAGLRTEIPRLRGSVSLNIAALSGPVSWPGEWQYEATGTLKDLVVDSSLLPEALEVKTGNFRIDAKTIRATGLEARTMDAVLRVSGVLDGYREGLWKLDATVDGRMGREAVRRIWARASLPADFRPAAPISLNDVHVGLAGGGALSLAGSFQVPSGSRVALDLVKDAEGTDIRRLSIADNASRASVFFRHTRGEVGIGFDGHLEAATLEALFAKRRQWRGRIAGDFQALVPLEHPERATAHGNLDAMDISVPTPVGQVLVESLDLRASGSGLGVASSLVLDEQCFSATGDATFRNEGLVLDMDVATGDISWEKVEKVLDRMKAKKEERETAAETGAEETPALGLGGVLHLSIGSFKWRDLEWKPVLADVVFGKGSAALAVREAALCGVSTTGELRFLGSGAMSVSGRMVAGGPDINAPFSCLGLEKLRMTGSYEAALEVEGRGAPSELPRLFAGPFSFRASKGRIAKATLLTRILAAVNVTGAFAGKTRDRVGDAMTYDEMSLAGELGDGRASLHEGILRSPAFTMAGTGSVGYLDRSVDLMVLSHPFSTMDKILRKIPVLRYILGRDFLSVAARVSGTLDDPNVSITPGRDVSQGLVNIFSRTVRLPVRVFDPAASKKQP